MAKNKDESERKKGLAKAYQSATQKLRDAHREEFDAMYAAEAKDLGIDWTPRKTPEQKAEEQLAALIEEYPHLAEKFRVINGEVSPTTA